MNRLLLKKFRNLVLILFGIFILFFLFRLGYGYTLKIEKEENEAVNFDYFENTKSNYASNDYKGKEGLYQTSNEADFDPIVATGQKYEKIAEIKTETHQFDKDERYVRNKVDTLGGVIQYEKKYGNTGSRKLQMQVGIPPENFDSLYEILIDVGITRSKQIIKNDKTNYYLELNAKKKSLEKTHESLVEFKKKNGNISEFVNLENRILEIEKELQSLGVNLGDFDKSNEFCTIKFALSEGKAAAIKTISFYHRCKVALEWTIGWYLRFISSTFFVLLVAYVFVYLGDKKEVIKGFFNWIRSKFEKEK